MRYALLIAALACCRVARADVVDLVQFTARDDAAAGWEAQRTKDGMTVERRHVNGSDYYEHRVIVELDLPIDRVAKEVWRSQLEGDMANLKHREILHQSENELLIYDVIATPVVSDRDYTITVTRITDASKHRTEIRCTTANDRGPPVKSGLVRIPSVHAGWVIQPGHGGKTELRYYAYSEPGGLITPILARGAQVSRALADMARMRDRVSR